MNSVIQSFTLTEFEIDWVNRLVVLAQGTLNIFVSWTHLASGETYEDPLQNNADNA